MFFAPIALNDIDVATHAYPAPQICEYETVAESFYPKAAISAVVAQWGRSKAASSLAGSEDRAAVVSRLSELSRLGSNWDSYGAQAIDKTCVENAQALMAALPEDVPSPEISPNPNGTLTLDWEGEDRLLSLEVGRTRYSCFWEAGDDTTETDEGRIAGDIPAFVYFALQRMFPPTATMPGPFEEFTIDVQGQPGSTASGGRG